MRISDWSSDVCSSDLKLLVALRLHRIRHRLSAGIDDAAIQVEYGLRLIDLFPAVLVDLLQPADDLAKLGGIKDRVTCILALIGDIRLQFLDLFRDRIPPIDEPRQPTLGIAAFH